MKKRLWNSTIGHAFHSSNLILCCIRLNNYINNTTSYLFINNTFSNAILYYIYIIFLNRPTQNINKFEPSSHHKIYFHALRLPLRD